MIRIQYLALTLVLSLTFDTDAALAKVVHLKNAMDTEIDVLITPVGTTVTRTVFIAKNGVSDFAFEGNGQFEIQVRPKDKPTGTNPEPTDLSLFDGKDFVVGGERGPDVQQCYQYRCRHRCYCCCYMVPGERTAVTFESTLPDGRPFFKRLPIMSYASALQSYGMRTWTNHTGSKTVVARLTSVDDDRRTLNVTTASTYSCFLPNYRLPISNGFGHGRARKA